MIIIYRFASLLAIKPLVFFFLFSTNVVAQKDTSAIKLQKDTFIETNPDFIAWQNKWVDLSHTRETKKVFNRFAKTYTIWVLTGLKGKKASFKNFAIVFKRYNFIGFTCGSTFMIQGEKYLLIYNFSEKWRKKLGASSFAIKYTDVIDIPPPDDDDN